MHLHAHSATLLMQTLLALCFRRLAPLCKLSHVPGGQGDSGRGHTPCSRRTEPNFEAESSFAFESRQQESVGGAHVNQLSVLTQHNPMQLEMSSRALSCLLWGCSSCSALNCSGAPRGETQQNCVLHILHRCVKTRCQHQALNWVHAAFLLEIVCKAT